MAIYIRRNDMSYGPYPMEEVRDLIAQGTLRLDDWAQPEGESHWRPLHEIPEVHFHPPPAAHPAFEMPGDNTDAVTEGPQIRPWVRYWARMFDTVVILIPVSVIFAIVLPNIEESRLTERVLDFISLILWVPVEAVFLTVFAATPGKAILRIKVVNPDGSKLSYPQALKRSFNVWLRGLGIGIPMVTIISLILSYKHLTKYGITSWDQIGRYRVHHRNVGALRASIIIATFVVLFGLVLIGLLAPKELSE